MGFDYEAPGVPATAVADVAAEISSHGKLRELTDEEKQQRRIENEIYLWECQQRDEERRLEHQRQRAEAKAEAERQAAIVAAQERERLRKASQERDALHRREREISDLKLRSAKQELWQSNVERAMQNTIAYQQRETLINALEAMITPPQPPSEPDVIYVEAMEGSDELGTSDFNVDAWMKKPRSWF